MISPHDEVVDETELHFAGPRKGARQPKLCHRILNAISVSIVPAVNQPSQRDQGRFAAHRSMEVDDNLRS